MQINSARARNAYNDGNIGPQLAKRLGAALNQQKAADEAAKHQRRRSANAAKQVAKPLPKPLAQEIARPVEAQRPSEGVRPDRPDRPERPERPERPDVNPRRFAWGLKSHGPLFLGRVGMHRLDLLA